MSWGWATCWPVPVSRIQKFLQRSTIIPSASWGVVLFNVYLNEIITKWQNQDITGIILSKTQELSTLLFADDQVVIADT